MSSAELSSLSSLLDDLLERVRSMVEDRTDDGGQPDEIASGLFEVERSLQEARRRLARAVELAS